MPNEAVLAKGEPHVSLSRPHTPLTTRPCDLDLASLPARDYRSSRAWLSGRRRLHVHHMTPARTVVSSHGTHVHTKPSHGTISPQTLPADRAPLVSPLRCLQVLWRPHRRPPRHCRHLHPASRSGTDNMSLKQVSFDSSRATRILDESMVFAPSRRASVHVDITPYSSRAAGIERSAL